ncbi:MAG: M43 family zinc metalloprotease, partial [Bacteroidota bacterium]
MASHRNRIFLLLVAFIALATPLRSQQIPVVTTPHSDIAEQAAFCGHSAYIAQNINPAVHRAFEQSVRLRTRALYHAQQRTGGMVHTIPVVVHVVHGADPNDNIPDEQVHDALHYLNLAFRNQSYYDPNIGVDVEIEFCLAVQDTGGQFTSGITRTQSPLANMTMETQDAALKALQNWDPTSYLNIWVVNSIVSTNPNLNPSGYATFPTVHGLTQDGIVIEWRQFGTFAGPSATLAHEAGHYLGLYHTFHGTCLNNDCLANGDRICDTPPDSDSIPPYPCNLTFNTCTSDADDPSPNNPFRSPGLGGLGDQPDMTTNYMDYINPLCYNAFTAGQKDRMRIVLTGVRASLLGSVGCQSGCMAGTMAGFTSSANNVQAGTTVNFTSTSTAAKTYSWWVGSNMVATTPNTSFTFNQAGNWAVKLVVENGPACRDSLLDTVVVTCGAQAAFSASALEILPGESVDLVDG